MSSMRLCDAALQIRHSSAHRLNVSVMIGTHSAFSLLNPLVLFRHFYVNFRIVRCPVFQYILLRTTKEFWIKHDIKVLHARRAHCK